MKIIKPKKGVLVIRHKGVAQTFINTPTNVAIGRFMAFFSEYEAILS